MIRKFILIVSLQLPTFVFSQTDIWSQKYKETFKNDCDHKVFDKVEEIPSLKVSREAYADSLTFFLREKMSQFRYQKFIFSCIVTSRSEIFNLRMLAGNFDDEGVFETAILNYSDLWLPARQNSHIVCSYVKLEMEFTKAKLNIRIYQ